MSDQSSPTHKKAHSSTVTRPVTAIVFLVTFFFTYLNAQTIVPAGLGPMSATQPNRETAILTGNLLRTGGQNPTVKIVWGDEDGEISGKSWDNTVVISTNQVVGSFSTTITIPNQEKIYYFRSVAENAGGTVVSRSLGVLNPSAPVGVADLRGRWSFDDDNFSDPVSPANFDNLQLWLDAADTSTLTVNSSNKVSQWNDKTENEIHAINSNTNNQPTLVANSQNGLSTLQFDGTNDYLIASSLNITQPYSIFAVAKSTAGSGKDYLFDGITNDNTRSLLTLRPNSGTVQIWANGWANSNINSESAFTTFSTIFNSSNSQISVNGMLVSGLSTGTYSLTNGIHLGTNYLANADFLGGNIAEFFIIDGVVNSTDRQKIEAYLARKWGIPLTNSVNSIHAAKDSSGSNYHGILKKKFAPTNLSSTPKLWLDASELSSAGASWSDKSSNGNNAAKTGSPAIISNFQNGNTVMHYTGNGQWHDFSAITDIRTVFWVVSQDSSANGSGFRFLLCGASSSHFHNNNNGKFWGIHAQNNIKSGYTRMDGSVLSGDTN